MSTTASVRHQAPRGMGECDVRRTRFMSAAQTEDRWAAAQRECPDGSKHVMAILGRCAGRKD